MSAAKKAIRSGPAPRVRQVQVDAEHTGQRLDNFLIAQLKGVPRTHIYRLLRRGEVRINKGRSRADYRIRCGDIVRIPPVRTAEVQAQVSIQDGAQFAWLEGRILYEDAALLAVDKPAGLAVHGGSGVSLGLIEMLRRLRPQARSLELVHRLDRDTSGCLLVAKKRSVLLRLHAMLREGQVDKRYQALLCGTWGGKTHTVTAPLRKQELRSGERRVDVDESGKDSATRFHVLRRYAGCGPQQDFAATLVEVELLTGRTHQARVHAVHAGHPIAGDEKYGDRHCNTMARALGLRRLFLHAARLRFEHPDDGQALVLEAPLPPELVGLLRRLDGEAA
ncbi:MAG: 23S rRNA pseudouridine(955/2504/2580) synthase RluC [Gammaproteobacteria bacterium]|nr:23S rRNA pseudouridine(955/2504/2580) synthase RluC [Gammaproteobacteria bacterium]